MYVPIFSLSAFVKACSINVGHESMILAVYEQVSSRILGGCIWAFYGVRCCSLAVYSTLVPIHFRNSLRCLFNIVASWDSLVHDRIPICLLQLAVGVRTHGNVV